MWTTPDFTKKNVKTFRAAPDLRGRVCTVDAARRLVDLVQRSCYAGFAIGCDKTQAMRRLPCYSGLELEVARRIVTAARKVVRSYCYSCVLRHSIWRLQNALFCLREGKNCVAEAQEEVAGRQSRAERVQIRSCSDKKQLWQEVSQRRGRSVKK